MMIKKILLFLILFINLFVQQAFGGATEEVLKDTAKGAVVGGAVGAAKTEAVKKVVGEGMVKDIGDFFDTPPGILIMSGMATIYSNQLYSAAAEQEDEANRNIQKVDRLIQSYKDSWQGYCPNGREKLEEPDCYCYLDTGKQNLTRSNSEICQKLWNKNQYAFNSKLASYVGNSTINDPTGCVGLNGAFDEACKCRKLLNSKGQNACYKVTNIPLSNTIAPAIMANTGLKDIMALASNAVNGSPNLNKFNTASLGFKAVASDKFTQDLLSKVGGNIKGLVPVYIDNNNVGMFAGKVIGQKNLERIIASSKPSSLTSSGPNLNAKSSKIVNDLKRKNSLEFSGDGKGLNNKSGEKKAGMDLNFGDSGAGGNGGQVIDNFPEKTYKYKNSDITTNESLSIFEIISNRYVQSGLKRLFDDGSTEVSTTPEAK